MILLMTKTASDKPWHFDSGSVPGLSQWDHLRREQILTAEHPGTLSHGSVMTGTLQWLLNHQNQSPEQTDTSLVTKEPVRILERS